MIQIDGFEYHVSACCTDLANPMAEVPFVSHINPTTGAGWGVLSLRCQLGGGTVATDLECV